MAQKVRDWLKTIQRERGMSVLHTSHNMREVETFCDRCLNKVELPVDRDFDLFYRPMKTIAREEEVEIPDDELEIGFYSGDGIQLADVVIEQVILAMPMKVICHPECLGLCPTCRADRNHIACNCPTPVKESPFASLKDE